VATPQGRYCVGHMLRNRKYGSPFSHVPLGDRGGVRQATSHLRPERTSAAKAPEPCEVDGCSRPKKGRRWCGPHYYRHLRHGEVFVEVPIGSGSQTLIRSQIRDRDMAVVEVMRSKVNALLPIARTAFLSDPSYLITMAEDAATIVAGRQLVER
jgi:hypothetical protein